MSPIFKSDTARAIAKEVGLGDLSRNSKTTKKRSLTISGSNPAVTEALNNHQAKVSLMSYYFQNSNNHIVQFWVKKIKFYECTRKFIRIAYYLAGIDKNLNVLGHICMI